jgi:Bacterial Ig domain
VSGTRVDLQVSASDDKQVTSVGFSVDHEWIGDDLTAPYSLEWNSTQVLNGPHTLVQRAKENIALPSRDQEGHAVSGDSFGGLLEPRPAS